MIRFLGFLFSAVSIAAIAGIGMIAMVLWVYDRDLPDYDALSNYEPATLSRVYSGEGAVIAEFARERRIFTPIDEIPQVVKNAFISAEDKNFYEHSGFDLRGIAAAAYEAIASRGQSLRGASTIPQQQAKNLLFSSDPDAERKIKEIIMSTRMVKEIGREKVLEIYLNEIFLGQQSFGVAAAAQTYFNKTLSELTVPEAAYLAILPKAPARYHPVRQEERAVTRRNFVLREMWQNGYLEDAAYEEARVAPLLTVQSGDREAFSANKPARDYFTEQISRQLDGDFPDGAFKTAGLTIRGTIDGEMQAIAAAALRDALEAYDRSQGEWRGAAATIEADDLEAQVDGAPAWRGLLANTGKLARDVDGWHPAVVLELRGAAARSDHAHRIAGSRCHHRGGRHHAPIRSRPACSLYPSTLAACAPR